MIQMLDIRLKEIYVNLKNHDFDVLGRYKMDKNEAKYPVSKAKGKADKYNKL